MTREIEHTANNITDSVYRQILEQIIAGRYRPGDRIPTENELKETFNVSRNTIRAALNRLNTLGILETRRGDGTYVCKPSMGMYINSFIPAMLINEDSFLEILEFRRAIEIAATRMAAERADENDIKALQHYLDISLSAGNNMQIYPASTIDFHVQIAKASKSQIFASMMELIKYIMTSKMVDFLQFTRNDRNSSFYHYMILECIKRQKPDEAAFMMEKHMNELVNSVTRYLNESR